MRLANLSTFAAALISAPARAVLIALCLVTMGTASAAAQRPLYTDNADGSRTLLGYVPSEARNATARLLSRADPNQLIEARIVLPLQNQDRLTALLKDIYDPASPSYRHFLTPDEFTQQFGPSAADSAQVTRSLGQLGLAGTNQSANQTTLHVSGSVAAFEHALTLHINNYVRSDGTHFFAPDTDPTIPAVLAGKVLSIIGLDNFPRFKPRIHTSAARANAESALTPKGQRGTAPSGLTPDEVRPLYGTSSPVYGLTPSEVATAYNLTAIPATGAGQTIALFQLNGYLSSDISTYESYFNLPNVPLTNILIDGFNGQPVSTDDPFEAADTIEMLAGLIPQNSNILVYEAPAGTLGWYDEWNQIATDDKAKVVSCSWGEAEDDSPNIETDSIVFQQMAAQGQAVFVAAGDHGAYGNGGYANDPTLIVDEPADQPYATGVGISLLATNSNGTYKNETASLYGGGGVSLQWTIPSYQVAAASNASPLALVSTTMRNVPDVVLSADPSIGFAVYEGGAWFAVGGSSLSTPIWAAFISLVNQGLEQMGQPALGFANPSLYQIAQSSSYANDFHQITTGNNGYYPAEPGFNDATGLGSFNGLNLYNDLIKNAMSATAPLTPTGLSVSAVNFYSVELTWNASTGATSYDVKRSTVSGGPYTTIASEVLNTTYVDPSATDGTTYYYVVSAVNVSGQSSNSLQVQATPVNEEPAAPTGLNAKPGPAEVILTWNMSVGASGYNVLRSTVNGGPYTLITPRLYSFYIDTAGSDANPPVNGMTYYYVVQAIGGDGKGTSPNSTQVQVTLGTGQPPAAPTGLKAMAGNGEVSLSWTASTGATSYNVLRSTVSGTSYAFLSSGVTNTSYVDLEVINGTTYYYVVQALNTSETSPNSTQAQATPVAPIPAAPTNLTAKAGNGQVSLSWFASTGALDYTLLRSTASGTSYTSLAAGINNTSYVDASVINGTTYYYVVLADNNSGASPNSTQVQATPLAPLTPTVIETPSLSSITTAQALSVTVAISGGSGNPTPTGSVTLAGGGYTSAATPLISGGATIKVPADSLATGTETLTATYTPDAMSSSIYNPSSATTSVIVTTPIPPGFTISGTAVMVAPGATTANTSTITVTPAGGLTGNIALTAAITSSPAGGSDAPTLSFGSTSPVSINGTAPGTASLTISTTPATSATLVKPKREGVPWYAAGGATLACILFFGIPARRRNWRNLLNALALLVAVTGGVLACGGGGANNSGGGGGGGTSNPGTTAGTYTITVTGTSGSITETGTVTLTVQ